MENTLFGSGNTKLTSGAISESFDLDGGLYKAMYEQSQMQLKIFEAMVKADSLSRKYQAQGIYSEAAIQAFNEDAKKKIGGAIKKMCSNFVEKVKKWWAAAKKKLLGIINKMKAWLRKHNPFKKKGSSSSHSHDHKHSSSKSSSSRSGGSGSVDNTASEPATSTSAPSKPIALGAGKAASPVMKALPAPDYQNKKDFTTAGKHGPVTNGTTPIQMGASSLDAEVNWYNPDVVFDIIDDAMEIKDIDLNDITQLHADLTAAPGDYDEKVDALLKTGRDRLDEVKKRFDELKSKPEVLKLRDIFPNPANAEKTIKQLEECVSYMDRIVNVVSKKFSSFSASEENVVMINFISQLQSLTMNILHGLQSIVLYVFQTDAKAVAKLGFGGYAEMADIMVEAAMYEAFMCDEPYDEYDLYSAEGIKRFAAARLEAAMDEISDVIDNAINSDNAQGIEDVNRASTEVLGSGVSNDPNKLTYDDDCYSQEYEFGDENIAGTVDANIIGTSTNVASGNETKAAVESFFFNW